MIWHIFRKDLKLLWPLVAAVAVAQLINALLQHLRGHFDEPHGFAVVALMFPFPVFLGVVALILICVHQDVLPGVRQDWLIRPIRRRDLLLAKLLFLLLAIHGPMLLADLVHGLAAGFSFLDCLTAALSRGIIILLAFSLLTFAIAAMTSNIVEAIGGALLIGLIAGPIVIGGMLFFESSGAIPPLLEASLGWMIVALWCAVALLVALVIIPLQYIRRATTPARLIALGAVFFGSVTIFLPWTSAWSFQQWVSGSPTAAQATAVTFDPSVGKYKLGVGSEIPERSMWLPLRVSGLPAELILITDRADIRVIDNDGTILFGGKARERGYGAAGGISARTEKGGAVGTHGSIDLPQKVYDIARRRPVRVELDYWLTLLRIDQRDSIAAVNADKHTRGFGWCKSRANGEADILIECLKPGSAPRCHSATLQGQGPTFFARDFCRPSYDPSTANLFPDAIGRLGFGIPPAIDVPVLESAQRARAQVTLKSYRPVSHFKRQVVIPSIRLSDWEAAAHEPAANSTP